MKKIIITATILMMCLMSIQAQSLAFLKDATRIKLEIDYSEAAINGFTEENILEFEGDWEKDQPVLYQKITAAMNETQFDRQYGKFENAEYTLIYRPLIINGKGDMKGYFVITNKSGETVATVKNVSAKGGRVGSFLNLVGDGMKHMGKVIAKKVATLEKKK